MSKDTKPSLPKSCFPPMLPPLLGHQKEWKEVTLRVPLDISLKSTAESYHSLGDKQQAQGELSSALQSKQGSLDIRLKLFGEEHSSTAVSYHTFVETQHALGDFSLMALQSKQRAFDIRPKLFRDEHPSTADS